MVSFFDMWILFGGLMAAVLGIGQLLQRNRSAGNLLAAAMLLCIAIWQCISGLWGVLRDLDEVALANELYLVAIVTYFWTGPLVYLYFRQALGADISWRPIYLLHLAPGIIAAVVFLFYTFLYPDIVAEPRYLYRLLPMALGYTSAVCMALYSLAVLLVLGRLLMAPAKLPPETARVAGGLMFAIALLSLGEIVFADDILNIIVTMMLLVLYWVGVRHPSFFPVLKDEAERVRYTRSQLEGLSVDQLVRQLRRLMEEEKIYQEETLSLKELSSRLEIKPHQLSELLNSRFGKNFYAYVNGYRIEHACGLLVERPDLSVSAVGYEVGFNSNSVFYEAFRKVLDVSPGAYRKERRAS